MQTRPKLLKILDIVAILLLITASWMVFNYAPMEVTMGNVQRVFYFHVSAGWLGMISFILALVSGIAYLKTANLKWDIVGRAGVEVGLVFIFINIVSGSIWARPAWNTWWTWDPRLVTATVMELIYISYLLLRQGIEDPERRARFGAIYAIIGSVSVPFTYFSIRYWRTIHPLIIGCDAETAEGCVSMTTPMLQTFMFSLTTFSIIAIVLLWHRIRLGYLSDKVDQLKMRLLS